MSNTSFNPYQQQIDELEKKIAEGKLLVDDPELGELASAELSQLEEQKKQLQQLADDFSTAGQDTSNPHETTSSNAIIEIRGGAGGDEAKIWANDLLRMYMRFCENNKLKVEYIDELVIKVKGKYRTQEGADGTPAKTLYPYTLFKYESGVHRVQRVPSTESQGRVHTSTASVAVLPEVKSNAVTIRDEDLEWQFIRAGGAGGQSVNKTSSAVRLTHTPTGIAVSSSRERKQVQNRAIALELLRSQLWEIEEEKRLAEIGEARSSIGRNMRAEKIRTYNYPQNRVTDHRITTSWYKLDTIIEGDILEVIEVVARDLNKDPEESSPESS